MVVWGNITTPIYADEATLEPMITGQNFEGIELTLILMP